MLPILRDRRPPVDQQAPNFLHVSEGLRELLRGLEGPAGLEPRDASPDPLGPDLMQRDGLDPVADELVPQLQGRHNATVTGPFRSRSLPDCVSRMILCWARCSRW
jgi:hypothetical protein